MCQSFRDELQTETVKWALPVSEGKWFYLQLTSDHTHLSWGVSCESSAISFYDSRVSITGNGSTSERASSSLILRLTSRWRWCNSMKVINHLPELRPHLSFSLWAPKLLLRGSDGCSARSCGSLLGQVKPALQFPPLARSLSFLLLSQDTFPWQYHSISYNVCACVCAAGDSPGLAEKTETALIRSDCTQPLQATKLPPFIHGARTSHTHIHPSAR